MEKASFTLNLLINGNMMDPWFSLLEIHLHPRIISFLIWHYYYNKGNKICKVFRYRYGLQDIIITEISYS